MKIKKTRRSVAQKRNSIHIVGSGRRVALKEMLKNQILNGVPFTYIDGRGDDESLSKVLKKIYKKRSSDVFILDFAKQNQQNMQNALKIPNPLLEQRT